METILITGGTGLVGQELTKLLTEKNYHVTILTSSKEKAKKENHFYWNHKNDEIDQEAISSADYIIHLAGANLSESRWTEKRKIEIFESRINTAHLLLDRIKKHNINLKGFIAASAVGIYGTVTTDKIFSENDPPASDYIGKLCQDWENSTKGLADLNIPLITLRIGVVLTNKGGAFTKLLKPVQMGIGSGIGSGKQYLPWIHVQDVCNMFLHALKTKGFEGTYNVVAPEHVTNYNLSKAIATKANKPFWMPNVPSFILKLIFGEMAVIFLTGSRISSEKIVETGYRFTYSKLENALDNLIPIQ